MSEPGTVSGEVQQVQAALQLFEQGREQIRAHYCGSAGAGRSGAADAALRRPRARGRSAGCREDAGRQDAGAVSSTFRRVQGTPDMMPADILGTTVFSPKTNEFSLHKGPVFTQFLLADEINRMPPRTQAALLESMEERQVTMDGEAHGLDDYFTVFATQNPLEFEEPTRYLRLSSTASSSRSRWAIHRWPTSAPFWNGIMRASKQKTSSRL